MSSSNCIYSNKHFIIIKLNNNSFIVYNTLKEFDNGHTHVNNYFIAKCIIYYCLKGEFPRKAKHLIKNKYINESINRVK